MKKNILEKLALILSVILFLVPKYIAPVCGPKEDGSHMACYFSGNMVMKLAGAIFISWNDCSIIFINSLW